MNISNFKRRRSPCLKPSVGVFKSCSSTMVELNIDSRVVFMNFINNISPSLSLFFSEKIGSSRKSLSSLTPRC